MQVAFRVSVGAAGREEAVGAVVAVLAASVGAIVAAVAAGAAGVVTLRAALMASVAGSVGAAIRLSGTVTVVGVSAAR